MTTRLRHRPQVEEEDASALKLGKGAPTRAQVSEKAGLTEAFQARIQQRRLSSHFRGQVLAGEQGEGCAKHSVRGCSSYIAVDYMLKKRCIVSITELWTM